ncbi:hypothetical protein BG004_005826 [Podila humilis]|nr:hypothetical protein BG004_005826 [Podila humilis]
MISSPAPSDFTESPTVWVSIPTFAPTATESIVPTPLSTPSLTPAAFVYSDSTLQGESATLLCDWIRSAADCRDGDFIRSLLIASSALHLFVFLFGFWLLVYRNRGLNKKIFTELFVHVGTGIRPKPMDCIIFFTGIASLVKVFVNIPLILDVLKDKLWLRIAIEQLYWIFVAVGFSSYFVGLLYAMPVTTRQGIFAIYQPESAFDAKPLPPIHVLTPTTVQKNFLLLMGAIYPTIFGWGTGVASAFLTQTPGYERVAKILLVVQYSNWVLILWSMAIMFLYYGLKYTFILRANIIIAEAALRAPKAAFGIGNLKSSSPARFLFIQLQITGFGGAAVTLLAGSLCMIWVLFRQKILEMEDDKLPHTMAFFWTCAIAVAFFVIMLLISIQSVRSRRRGRNEPSTSLTNSFLPSSGQRSGGSNNQKNGSLVKDPYSAPIQQKSSFVDSESGLAQRNSGEHSTLNSINSMDKSLYGNNSFEFPEGQDHLQVHVRRMENDAFSMAHSQNKMEQERRQRLSDSPLPARPFTIIPPGQASVATNHRPEVPQDQPRRGSDVSSSGQGRVNPDLRTSVFGRAARSTSPPPSVPTSPSFPMKAMRPSSRNSPQRSADQVGTQSNSSHTLSSTSSQLSHLNSKEYRFSIIPEELKVAKDDFGGDLLYNNALHQHSQGTQYQHPISGLTPPPRSQRGPQSNTHAPPSPEHETFTAPVRDTLGFGHSPALVAQAQGARPQFSTTPRVGGGVRRKSIKDASEDDNGTSWPVPPS